MAELVKNWLENSMRSGIRIEIVPGNPAIPKISGSLERT